MGTGQNSTRINIIQPSISFGRKVGDILITNDTSISRSHASIRIQNNKMTVVDLNSKYGVYVNDKKVTESSLKLGDVLKIGQFESVYKVEIIDASICLSAVSKKQEVLSLAQQKFITIADIDHCKFLVVDEFKVTKKTLIALCRGIHIVKPSFIHDISLQYWPDPFMYLPDQDIKYDPKMAIPNKKRETLFLGKVIVVFTQASYDAWDKVIEHGGGSCVFEKNCTICKCTGCDDQLCMARYCDCTDLNCSSLHLFFLDERKRDKYIDAIHKDYKLQFLALEALTLAILECDFPSHCILKTTSNLARVATGPQPTAIKKANRQRISFNYELVPLSDNELGGGSIIPEIMDGDDPIQTHVTFNPITDQVDDLFFARDDSVEPKRLQNTIPASEPESFNESVLKTQPKACSNLDDLLDEMMDMGEVMDAPELERPVIPKTPTPEKPAIAPQKNSQNIENEMHVDFEVANSPVPDKNQDSEIVQSEIIRKDAPISLSVEEVVIEYDNLIKRKPNQHAVNFKRFRSKYSVVRIPTIIPVIEANLVKTKNNRNNDFFQYDD